MGHNGKEAMNYEEIILVSLLKLLAKHKA